MAGAVEAAVDGLPVVAVLAVIAALVELVVAAVTETLVVVAVRAGALAVADFTPLAEAEAA
jgi:hypothetical protein